MSPETRDTPTSSFEQAPGEDQGRSISPAMVRKIARKVYAMLLAELIIERERYRTDERHWQFD